MTENKSVTIRSIVYDTVSLKPGSVIYEFFQDDYSTKDERVNSILERELVKFLFDPFYRFYEYLIYEELGISNSYIPFYEKSQPIIENANEKPGDIDLILVDKSQVGNSLGFQVKRFKGFIDADGINKVKFSNIEEGIIQVNKMFEKYKFYKNYLMLIVANDGMNNTKDSFLFRQVKGPEIKPLYSMSTYENLKEGIGLFIVEITQPTGKGIRKTGKIATKLLRDSKLNMQSKKMTNKIKLLVDATH